MPTATLAVFAADTAGNWPMELSVAGLPVLPKGQHYALWLTLDGQARRPVRNICGHGWDDGRPTQRAVPAQEVHGLGRRSGRIERLRASYAYRVGRAPPPAHLRRHRRSAPHHPQLRDRRLDPDRHADSSRWRRCSTRPTSTQRPTAAWSRSTVHRSRGYAPGTSPREYGSSASYLFGDVEPQFRSPWDWHRPGRPGALREPASSCARTATAPSVRP